MAESAHDDRVAGGGRPSSARWRSTLLLGLPAIVMVVAALLISVYERTALLATEGVVTLDAVRGASLPDAVVMASAALRGGGVVYTSDPRDLGRLQLHFPSVRVLPV